MMTRIFGLAVIASAALLAGGDERASAITATCSSEYTGSNGGTSIATATDIGTVAAGCEIGPFVSTGSGTGAGTNLSGTPASVGGSGPNPSIYKFEWGGGNLTIQELLGNNGTGDNIYIELGLASDTLNSNNTLSSPIASVPIADQSGPTTTPTNIITNMFLASGTYVLDNYLDNSSAVTDPNYAVLFTPVATTPLPAALPLFAGGLGLLGMFSRRRKQKASAIGA